MKFILFRCISIAIDKCGKKWILAQEEHTKAKKKMWIMSWLLAEIYNFHLVFSLKFLQCVTASHLQAVRYICERNATAASAQYLHFKSLTAVAASWAEASK